MKGSTIITVRVAQDDADAFFNIREEDAREMMKRAPEARFDFFRSVAKEARVHSTAEADLYIDASGNQTDKEFWESEGDEGWQDYK